MALSTLDTLPRGLDVGLERKPVDPETSHALGGAATKIIALDDSTRMMRLAMEDSSRFPSPLGINNHDRPGMIARDDMTGMFR